MVRYSDWALSCKTCAFQHLFAGCAGCSSDICSFWPIQRNASFTSIPIRSPTYWTEAETNPFSALHIFSEIHAGAQIDSHRSLWSWRNSWRRREKTTGTCPHRALWGPSLNWQIPNRTLLQFRQRNETAQGLGPHLMKANKALWLLLWAVTLHQGQIWCHHCLVLVSWMLCLLVSPAEVKLTEVPQSNAIYSVQKDIWT